MKEDFKNEIRNMGYDEAIAALTEYIAANPEDDEALTMRGMRYWGAGKRSLAIKDYLAAVKINDKSMAREALKAANAILDYRNTDLINP